MKPYFQYYHRIMPFFSIIIPSYNRAHVIQNTIKGVLEQTFDDFELIIVDDGSTDNTNQIVNGYLDKRIHYIYQNNNGVCSARNTGAKNAAGNYLIFLDSDDSIAINGLKEFHDTIQNSQFDIVYCSVKMLHPNGMIKLIDVNNPYNIVGKNGIKGTDLTGSWVVKKSLFLEVGGYDEKIKFGENNELRLRFNYQKPNVGIVNNYNFIYNVSPNGGGKNHFNKVNSIEYILDKHKDYYNLNKNSKKLFLQSAAVSAIKIGDVKKGNSLFKRALVENKLNSKLWIQYIVSLNKHFSKLKWKSDTI